MTRKRRFQNKGAGKGVKEALDAGTLRELYLERGLTQAQIASRYGCTPQYISLLLAEYDLRRDPSPPPEPRSAK
ncbi:MAG: helix-turn-helix transcriptional regulator [Chloroflexi bacterium]|nr:helix-turn-helix transcriptional regulator [Chloroflexota bacterium]